MYPQDLFRLTIGAILAHRSRSLLTSLGIAVGITAVVLLTAIGQGVQRFVLTEVTQFGTNLLVVTPGKTGTFGISGAVISNVRPLSIGDAEALATVSQVRAVVPLVQGNAAVETNGRTRRTTVFGVGHAIPEVWQIQPLMGRFLPPDELLRARPFAVLGSKLHQELFGSRSPLGQRIRIGSETYRVIGVMQSKGQMLGFDLDDTVYIPIARAMAMFDRESLMEVDILYAAGIDVDKFSNRVKQRLKLRHGREDFTITTQDQMLNVLGSVLEILTLVVGALGGISLLVGGVGIFTIMTIAVRERGPEIGLFRALGASRKQILSLFLGEAVILATLGGISGLVLGLGSAWLLGVAVPSLPTHPAWSYTGFALVLSTLIGLIAGIVPAINAAHLQPVEALRNE